MGGGMQPQPYEDWLPNKEEKEKLKPGELPWGAIRLLELKSDEIGTHHIKWTPGGAIDKKQTHPFHGVPFYDFSGRDVNLLNGTRYEKGSERSSSEESEDGEGTKHELEYFCTRANGNDDWTEAKNSKNDKTCEEICECLEGRYVDRRMFYWYLLAVGILTAFGFIPLIFKVYIVYNKAVYIEDLCNRYGTAPMYSFANMQTPQQQMPMQPQRSPNVIGQGQQAVYNPGNSQSQRQSY
jgi:hypothetical protein